MIRHLWPASYHFSSRIIHRWYTGSSAYGPRKGDKVVVAMSGGVDSSVAAMLLAQKEYDLSAVYMRNWDTRDEFGSDKGCEWEREWEDVQQVCRLLGLPCELINLSNQYWLRVFEPALGDWADGRSTPNPDIWCNREIKFGYLLERLLRGGKQWLATGHYAKIAWTQDGRPQLRRARDRNKDQTFFLSSIAESSLCKALFPLGNLLKSEVRALARRANLPTAEREESMGICFVGEKRRFSDFLSQYIPPKQGDIVNLDGAVLAQHQGLWRYTIGQGARIRGMHERMFVASKDPEMNQILVVPGTNHPALYCRSIALRDWKWIWPEFQLPTNLQVSVQFRHLMSAVPCLVQESSPSNLKITFIQPEKAVAPGQVAVLWEHDWCLGCGTIEETFP